MENDWNNTDYSDDIQETKIDFGQFTENVKSA